MPSQYRSGGATAGARYRSALVIRARRPGAASRIQAAFRGRSSYRKVQAVKKIAAKVVDSKNQTHHKVLTEPRTAYNNSASVVGDLRPVLPGIIQAGQLLPDGTKMKNNIESREGNKLHLQSIRIQGIVTIPSNDLPDSNDRAMLACRLLCFSCDKFKTHEALSNEWDSGENLRESLLRQGASAVGFDGTLAGLWLPLNTEMFTTHYDRTFYLARGQVVTLTAGTEGRGAAYMPASYRSFKINLKVKNKLLTYSNPDNTFPTNYAPSLILMFAYVNGAGASASTVPFMQFNSTARWKDE